MKGKNTWCIKMCEKVNGSTFQSSVFPIAMDFNLFEIKRQTRVLRKKFNMWVLTDN